MKATIRYKLTDKDMRTYRGFLWKPLKWYTVRGVGELCTKGWFHLYTHPLLAILLSPIFGSYENPRLFRAEVRGRSKTDCGLKEGWSEVRLTKEIEPPVVNMVQRIAFGILCVLEVYTNEELRIWANKRTTTWVVKSVADLAARAAAESATAAAESAVDLAARAAKSMRAAEWAAEEALAAAESAAATAREAAIYKDMNLIKLAKKAMEIK